MVTCDGCGKTGNHDDIIAVEVLLRKDIGLEDGCDIDRLAHRPLDLCGECIEGFDDKLGEFVAALSKKQN